MGEDAAASKNLVYVHSSDVEQEGYDKTADEWTWTRKVISDGQEIEITEVGDALTYLNQMDRYGWYEVKFNADNEVISIAAASDALGSDEYVGDIKNLNTAINKEDTVLYTEGFLDGHPTMRGSTLYVTTHTTDDDGFFVAEDVNIALIQWVKNKQETTFETGVDELENIIDDLNEKNGEFDYQISAILEDGAATSVVIYDKTNTYERPEDGDKGDADKVTVVVDDTTIYTVRNTPDATSVDEAEAIEQALNALGYTEVEATAEGGKITAVSAKKGSLTTKFEVNPADDSTATASNDEELAEAIEAGKDTVILGSAEYTIQDAITNDLTIVGNGDTVLKSSGKSYADGGLPAAAYINGGVLKVSGVTFEATEGVSHAIMVGTNPGSYIEITDCTFEGIDTPVYINTCAGGVIKDCTFINGGCSYVDGLTGKLTITDCVFSGTADSKIYTKDAEVSAQIDASDIDVVVYEA